MDISDATIKINASMFVKERKSLKGIWMVPFLVLSYESSLSMKENRGIKKTHTKTRPLHFDVVQVTKKVD